MTMEFTGERFVPTLKGEIKYEHLHRYALSMLLAQGKTVLDLASGEGYGSSLLAKVANSVIGVDIDADSVEYANQHYQHYSNLKFMVGSCDAIPLEDQSVDLVTSFETIEHHDKHEEMMLEIKRVLKPNGVLIISSPNRLTYSDEPNYVNPYHVKELYYDELNNLVQKHFQYLKIYGQKLETGSFIFELDDSTDNHYKAFSGNSENVDHKIASLNSPIYFVAICSDENQQLSNDLNSIYLDPDEELWTEIKQERQDLQTFANNTQNNLQQVETKCNNLEDELNNFQIQWQQKCKNLEDELNNYQIQWQQKCRNLEDELNNYQIQWQQKCDSLQEELNNSQIQLEEQKKIYEAKCKIVDKQLKKQETILEQAQNESFKYQKKLEEAQQVIQGMESSKFWKLRQKWFSLKQKIKTLLLISSSIFLKPKHRESSNSDTIAKSIDKSGLFDPQYYLTQNPDVEGSGIDPLFHYLHYGSKEGRLAWSVSKLNDTFQKNNWLQNIEFNYIFDNLKLQPISNSRISSTTIAIYSSSLGNYYMTEIADLIAAGFRSIGINVIRLSENDNRPQNIDYDLVIAPHEFFYLGKGESWQKNYSWLSKTIMVNVEQPQTSWFSKSFHILRQSALILDINLKSAIFLKQIGLPAHFLPLGYLSNYQPFTFYADKPNLVPLNSISSKEWTSVSNFDSSLGQRFIDILFVGHLNNKREKFFAKNASWLSNYRCFLHIPPVKGPLLKTDKNTLSTEAVIGLSQRSKILLNINQGELDYFPWHRIIFHGLWQKTLVITEPCHPIPKLSSGEDYIESSLDEMESKINWFLNRKEGIEEAEKIRQSGYNALTTRLDFEPIIKRIFNLFPSH